MPLYIRDDKVDELATQLWRVSGAKTKTAAVQDALLAALEAHKSRKSLLERLQPVLDRADQLGPGDPNFDMKAFTDEMWDER